MSDHGYWVDSQTGAVVLDLDAAVPPKQIALAVQDQYPQLQQLATTLARWGASNQTQNRSGGLFERDRFVTPDRIFDQFRVALDAAESDDVVAGIVESTEAMAFSKMSIETDDEDEEDVWNQIAGDLDLDSRLREMWRELFTVSQFYACVLWGVKDFKVRGKSQKGVTRKKEFKRLRVPIGVSLLDPLKVIPVGNFLFNQERLAYIATEDEALQFDEVLAGTNTTDLVVLQFIERRYEPSRDEKKAIVELTGARNLDHMFLLNAENVWRHTATRPTYQKYATVRLRSVFELLDLKHQLRNMDRTFLLAGTNFIILCKIGSDDYPAKPSEVAGLAGQVRTAARVPVIVGDHRLDIEIVTPSNDQSLKPERYNTLDARISARLFQLMMTGNYAAGAKGDDSIKLARVIARGMESRRHMMRRALEEHLLKPCFERNDEFTTPAKIRFHPKRIALDFDSNVATFLQDLRDRGDISRDTMLAELDLNQAEEARKREREKEKYDKIFEPTNVPFSSPNGGTGPGDGPAGPKAAGRRQGGNQQGGGSNPDSSTPNSSPAKPRKGNSS